MNWVGVIVMRGVLAELSTRVPKSAISPTVEIISIIVSQSDFLCNVF